MVIFSVYNLVDAIWVAKLGYQSMAALTVTMPFYIICIAVGAGTGIGVNAVASRRFGERDVEAANKIVGQTFFLCLFLGIVFLFATNLFPQQILIISGATPDILELGVQYISVLGWAMPLFLFGMVSRNIFQASGDAIRPMIFVVIGQAINIVLDPVLIFGWGFFPEMGISGAALATVIASSLSSILALGYILSGKTAYRIRFHHCVPNPSIVWQIYKVGLPSMFMQMTESVGFAFFNNVAARFGSIVLAATGIAGRVSDLAFMIIIGTAHGLLPIIGFSLGAKLWNRLWGAVKLASIWLVGFLIGATAILEIFTPQIIGFFNSDPALLEIAVPGMRIFCSTMVIIGPTIIFITTFQGLSKGIDGMVLSLGRQFIFIPGLFLFSHFWGLTGVWISMPVSDILGFTAAGFWLLREYRLQNRNAFQVEKKNHEKGQTAE
jgi:putative MATE family efflux protein